MLLGFGWDRPYKTFPSFDAHGRFGRSTSNGVTIHNKMVSYRKEIASALVGNHVKLFSHLVRSVIKPKKRYNKKGDKS